ncbi:MAG: alaS [Burkholderiaceae bacterium]|nr:alaS [Burkholderiaceae bacterium]
MQVADIRSKFLQFFADKGHTIVASSPLVPQNDPTLMFTNSGMVQFKDVFLGQDKRPYKRATSVQACLRAGGKHNDLENVGYTARHHTFFEMLGNWSFGDYFKRDSIKWGWELLTQIYGLPAEKLLATVYHEDDEAYDIWTKEIGLPPERVIRIGDNKGGKYKSDNFWMMADTGPCGPCSEIFYDHGEHIWGGPPGSAEEDGDRFIEIWNHVFMQFEMHADGSVSKLPAPCVDTGMGLERLAAILQGVHSNYEIDLFAALIGAAMTATACTDVTNPSLRVIADHIRACTFLVADGVIPSNEGRGYVLRRIIRRAIRHGYKLGVRTPFFHKLVAEVVNQMGAAYPIIAEKQALITAALKQEEERFFETIAKGMEILDEELNPLGYVGKQLGVENFWSDASFPFPLDLNNIPAHIKNAPLIKRTFGTGNYVNFNFVDNKQEKIYVTVTNFISKQDEQSVLEESEHYTKSDYFFHLKGSYPFNQYSREIELDSKYKVLSGTFAFQLHDTFGFPLDLTADVCRERGFTVDNAGFEIEMNAQKDTARAAGKFKMDKTIVYDGAKTQFTGYTGTHGNQLKVLALYKDSEPVTSLNQGEQGIVILDVTPFYAESGGQVGDKGLLSNPNAQLSVQDTLKVLPDVHGHFVTVDSGTVNVGDVLNATVYAEQRAATIRNHSATHLMHKALRLMLGEHVAQKGSLVDADKTRFDFTHNAPVTAEEITQIEYWVNAQILANTPVDAQVMDIESAKNSGAMMLFGEKYGDEVRVLSIGESKELCGGIHVKATGDIGQFKIISEGGVAAGVRRIEAVTGLNALAHTQHLANQVNAAAAALRSAPSELVERIVGTQESIKSLEKELAQAKNKLAASQGGDLASQAVEINGVKVLSAIIDGADIDMLRTTMDGLKDKLGNAVIVLASATDKATLLAGVTKDLTSKIKAGEVVNHVAQQIGGKGGGRPDLAQAGGTDVAGLSKAMASVAGFVQEKFN